MNTYTTRTGINVLLPQVPIETDYYALEWDAMDYHVPPHHHHFVELGMEDVDKNCTILGTCWREGGKLICDFDPAQFIESDEDFGEDDWSYYKHYLNGGYELKTSCESWDSWLLSIGEKIKEGHKIVVIKVE